GSRLVRDDGAGRDNAGASFYARVHSGGIYKRLEDGAGLALCEHVVELAGAVVPSAGERFDLACVRVERDERDLRLRNGLALETALLTNLLVHLDHAVADRFGGGTLEAHVERGVDA